MALCRLDGFALQELNPLYHMAKKGQYFFGKSRLERWSSQGNPKKYRLPDAERDDKIGKTGGKTR
ncbi:MAG: hypothetical protein LUB60_04190 [Clostridiales bacterium]|nr:hypothetical protein [Clostridiales bacterium]